VSAELRAAIERLYEVFAVYPLRPMIDGCSHCVSEDEVQRLRSQPLRELDDDDLRPIASSVILTWGDARDLRHLLPRLFELIAHDDNALFGPEMLVSSLRFAKWREWPEQEQDVVEAFLHAVWWDVLRNESRDAESWICAIGNAVDDVTPFLLVWQECRWPAGIRHLASFAERNQYHLAKSRKLGNAFWAARREQMAQVVEWMTAKETVDRIAVRFAEEYEPELEEALMEAMDRLTWLQSGARVLTR
jgi:hypothetical protein